MSLNKNALLRYKVLDRCFSNSARRYFAEDLLNEVNKALKEFNGFGSGIKRRQLFDDIRFMESEQGWSVPLGKFRYGRRVYYQYTEPRFSIQNEPLNDIEKNQIAEAVSVLTRFSGAPQFEWIHDLVPLVQDELGVRKKHREVISLESNVDLQGLDYLPILLDAITSQVVLHVTYQDFRSEEPYLVVFHPYYLKQYNNRWFIFGRNEDKDINTWNLAIDRIQNIEHTSSTYKPCDIDWEDYFYDLIGVTRPENADVERIELEVSSYMESYLLTKPLHASQRTRREHGKLIVTINVVVNYELQSILLSFGNEVIVRSPKYLKDEIYEKLLKAINNYGNNDE